MELLKRIVGQGSQRRVIVHLHAILARVRVVTVELNVVEDRRGPANYFHAAAEAILNRGVHDRGAGALDQHASVVPHCRCD